MTGESDLGEGTRLLYLCIALLLILSAGLMSGLTLGLLTLDEIDLGVLLRAGTDAEKQHAAKIQPVIRRQHWLLVTLLLCNALAMEALPIFLDRLMDPVSAVVFSVTFVLIFGEVIPQAVCARYGLEIGARSAAFVNALMWITSPISYSIGWLLDRILGVGHPALFQRGQLKALVDIHGSEHEGGMGGDLTRCEIHMIRGALDLHGKRARDAMTPLSAVPSLSSDAALDPNQLATLVANLGCTQVPVHEPGHPDRLVGSISLGDLTAALVAHVADVMTEPLRVADVRRRALPRVAVGTPLVDVFSMFTRQAPHVAAVDATSSGGAAAEGAPCAAPAHRPASGSDPAQRAASPPDSAMLPRPGTSTPLLQLISRGHGNDASEPSTAEPLRRAGAGASGAVDRSGTHALRCTAGAGAHACASDRRASSQGARASQPHTPDPTRGASDRAGRPGTQNSDRGMREGTGAGGRAPVSCADGEEASGSFGELPEHRNPLSQSVPEDPWHARSQLPPGNPLRPPSQPSPRSCTHLWAHAGPRDHHAPGASAGGACSHTEHVGERFWSDACLGRGVGMHWGLGSVVVDQGPGGHAGGCAAALGIIRMESVVEELLKHDHVDYADTSRVRQDGLASCQSPGFAHEGSSPHRMSDSSSSVTGNRNGVLPVCRTRASEGDPQACTSSRIERGTFADEGPSDTEGGWSQPAIARQPNGAQRTVQGLASLLFFFSNKSRRRRRAVGERLDPGGHGPAESFAMLGTAPAGLKQRGGAAAHWEKA